MAWCPNCRAEYRPGFTHCDKCQIALVEEEPGQPPRVAGWLVEEKTAASLQKLLPFCRQFLDGLQTARQALKLVLGGKKLLLVVLLLVLASAIGNMTESQVILSQQVKNGQVSQPIQFPDQAKPSFSEAWLNQFRSRNRLDYLVGRFDSPLAMSTNSATPWLMTAVISLQRGKYLSWSPQNLLGFLWFTLISFWESVVILAFNALILVGFLGWLQAHAQGLRSKSWRSYLKAHYWPIFWIEFCFFLGIQMLFFLSFGLRDWAFNAGYSAPGGGLDNFVTMLNHILGWVSSLVGLLLTLVFFVIVSRNLRAWNGVKAGIWLLWERKWTLLAVFVGYRIIYEIITIVVLLLPGPEGSGYTIGFRLALFPSYWFRYLATTFLDLWLAMVFTLLVQPKTEPETAAALDGAPN